MTTITDDDAKRISLVETRTDRLNALHGTLLRCIGALGSNTDATSHLVCEALQHAADDLGEMLIYETHSPGPPRGYRNVS